MLPAVAGWSPMTAIKNLVTLLVISLLGSGVLGWFLFQTRSDNDALRAQLTRLEGEHAEALKLRDEQLQRAIEDQAAKHQQTIDTINAEHEKALASMRQGERSRLATAAKEFENIFEGNKATLGYLNSLEDKVKAGQALAKADVERLTIITTGLGYLKKQYQKPMQEFTELQAYFEAQASKVTVSPRAISSSACSARSSARRKRNTSAAKAPARPSSRRRVSSRRSIPKRRKPWAP